MYMVDGKPIQVPYGRRNVNVTKLELEDTVAALLARIEALEDIVHGDFAASGPLWNVELNVDIPEFVEHVEDHEDEPAEVDGEQPKPRRGRKPKEATE